MAAADVALPPPNWAALQQQLNKKATFEATTKALAEQQRHLSDPAARALLARCRQLLKARYTGRPFWVAGRQLFQAALPAASGDAAFQQELQEYIAECNEFLGEADDAAGTSSADGGTMEQDSNYRQGGSAWLFAGAPPPTTSSSYLFEGQLSAGEGRAPPPRRLGLVDLLGSALGQQVAAAQAAAEQQQQQQQQGGAGDGGGAAAAQEQQEAQQQDPTAGLSPEVLQALETELDAIAVQIMEETGGQAAHQRPPPASKKVVASLPREALTAERLLELGGPDVRCPVCMEELSVGEEVQVMPCTGKHVFHPPCLAPWLAENNSCPTCRHELPTDDQRYERAKEREREEEEERRGAANAVSHNDFMYI